jgi:hypothetical protein
LPTRRGRVMIAAFMQRSAARRAGSGHPGRLMMKSTYSLATLALSLALGACATTSGGGNAPNIRVDYDHSANFSAYKTFAFVAAPGTDVEHLPPEITADLKAATRHELEARGYRFVDAHPDLLVNFAAKLSEQTRNDNLANQQVGYYGYRQTNLVPVYRTWSTYTFDNDTTSYVEGTLNVEIIDAARSQMVWEGVAIGEVKNPNQPVSQIAPMINKVVAEIFQKYPFKAGH